MGIQLPIPLFYFFLLNFIATNPIAMKNLMLSPLGVFLFLGLHLVAQGNLQFVQKNIQQYQAPRHHVLYTGMEPGPLRPVEHQSPPATDLEKVDQEIPIGSTLYDLQSNAAGCKRISMTPTGRIAGVWTRGIDDAGATYPDRGTGYNTRVNFAWGDPPSSRIESVRTGWPNHVFTASGKEFIVAHTSDNRLITQRRDGPTAPWAEGFIPDNTPSGMLWPRAAVGGANGETIHVIAITVPASLNGQPYQNVDGHILYYRSTDGGASWDRTDVAIEGLGSDFTLGSDADSYYIDARGDNVAFGIFNSFDDVLLFKSEDNGDTWAKSIVNDFPLFKYAIDAGYTYQDLPPFMDERPDSLAIFSSDSYGTVLVDYQGMAHVYFGRMWVQDDVLTDGLSSYYPGTDGLAYWNESFGDDSLRTIVGTVDQNMNDTLDLVAGASGLSVGLYFASLTSMPSAGVDAAGNLYVTYSGIVEGEVSIDDDMQHYRHVYIISSPDGGLTWSDPYDIIRPDIVMEPDLVDFVEAVFPSMVREVDDKVRLIYMQDFRPGLAIRGDMDSAADNFINYVQVEVPEVGIVGTEARVPASTFGLVLAPNVTSTQTRASFITGQAGKVSLSLLNRHGQQVRQFIQEQLPAGKHQEDLDLTGLPAGSYYLLLKVEQQFTIAEVIKQ
ncbi:MAG: hypothetical protein DA408_06600 [Bacteroidetes bacterium]|nr:MAG: hypothetical protein C7N36_12815 [Bacteroidota bacterium]PTM13510.1 MAG: hypothetical protein DA408_06600 [Bacteroidota bacterium]